MAKLEQPPLRIERAQPDQIGQVAGLLNCAGMYQALYSGFDEWQVPYSPDERLQQHIDNGDIYLGYVSLTMPPVATVSISTLDWLQVWPESQSLGSALYLSHLAKFETAEGAIAYDVCQQKVEHAAMLAASIAIDRLRLAIGQDSRIDNRALFERFVTLGFQKVGEVPKPQANCASGLCGRRRQSLALMECDLRV